MDTWFDAEFFQVLRKESGIAWGAQLVVVDSTASTNDDALRAVTTRAKTGSVWLARHQENGRGRRGNVWVSPPGDNLLTSVLFRYRGQPARFMGLSLVVGLAIRDIVEQRLGEGGAAAGGARVKWPNDVMVGGKKIAGVLVETRAGSDDELGVVIGVGLNVKTTRFPQEASVATSLAAVGASESNCRLEIVLADLLRALDSKIDVFMQEGLRPFVPELNGADYLEGRRVRVGSVEGLARGIDSEGRLLVQTRSGSTQPVISGSVDLLD